MVLKAETKREEEEEYMNLGTYFIFSITILITIFLSKNEYCMYSRRKNFLNKF